MSIVELVADIGALMDSDRRTRINEGYDGTLPSDVMGQKKIPWRIPMDTDHK